MNDWYCMGIKLLSYVLFPVEYMVCGDLPAEFPHQVLRMTETASGPLELYKSLARRTVSHWRCALSDVTSGLAMKRSLHPHLPHPTPTPKKCKKAGLCGHS
jgi:hypothetical protein